MNLKIEIVFELICYYNQRFNRVRIRKFGKKKIDDSETILGSQNCNIDDKSYASLTFQLNAMFRNMASTNVFKKQLF